ncbi:MAG: kynureninase, partial [Saprospiraceae bacterium]|nr:kynureninase [Saprospiraceae bacterium]
QVWVHKGDPDRDVVFWKPRKGEHILRYGDLADLLDDHQDQVALVFIGGVNYYTGQSFDLRRITEMGHARGIPVGFDLAHGAGNIDYQLHDSGADFAAWCSYKYLNSGPGSLSGIFVHARHHGKKDIPRFEGWWGHNKETRFGMRDPFDPLPGAEAWQLSNPPILPLAAMRASLELFVEAGMEALRQKSVALTGLLAELLATMDHPDLEVITPSDPEARGCQLSLFVKRHGKTIFDELTEHGVIADWREPDVIRIAPVPLYNTYADVVAFGRLLETALTQRTTINDTA